MLATTSRLPHVLAFGLVDTLSQLDSNEDIFRYAAGGFRDFTRIASSDAQMWSEISVANAPAILNVLEHYQSHLANLKNLIEAGDGEALLDLFDRARRSRDSFIKQFEATED